MAQTIVEMFYSLGGYDSSDVEAPNYISLADVNDTYVPIAVKYFNNLCVGAHTVSVSTASTTGDLFDDRIVAEVSCYLADADYDNLHADADGVWERENRHKKTADDLILMGYGVRDRRSEKVVFPVYADDSRAASYMGVATSSY